MGSNKGIFLINDRAIAQRVVATLYPIYFIGKKNA